MMTVSDPNRPGAPTGADADTTMIRSSQEFYGDGEAPQGENRADRVREWVSKRNHQRNAGQQNYPGASMQPSPDHPAMPPSVHRSDRTPVTGTTPAGAPGTEASSAGGSGNSRVAGALTGAGNFANRLKEKAKVVSAGMAGAAAGAMGNHDNPDPSTGQAASAVPAPNEETTAIRRGVGRRTRKARLRLSQVDPWSVMKTAFLFSVAAGIVLWVATGTVWAVISSSGMFEEINRMVGDIIQTPGDDTPFRIQDYISTNKVMGTAALIAVIDVVIFTALATLGAFLYNLASAMIGGLEVTLAED
jgi:hypothetical protein